MRPWVTANWKQIIAQSRLGSGGHSKGRWEELGFERGKVGERSTGAQLGPGQVCLFLAQVCSWDLEGTAHLRIA